MLPKSHRLAKNRIEHILKKGRKKSNHFFTIKYLPNSRHNHSRFCVMTSIKISPKAVERNRLRRQIYEIFRLNPQLPTSPYDLVVIVKPPLSKLSFQELTKSILINLQNLTP